MNFPPMIMQIQISRKDRGFNLWLPLFIIFPIVVIIIAALFLLLLPLMLIAAVILWRLGLWRPLFFFWPAVFGCFCAMRGLEVDIDQDDAQVFISVK